MKRIAVILSGCGVFDGAEIHESVLTLLALDDAGAKVTIAAPDGNQHHVIDHGTGQETGEVRSIRTEAARIARGHVKAVGELNTAELDAAIFPGGFGAAKNISTFALEQTSAKVNSDVEKFILALRGQDKPMGFLCIAPAIAAQVLGPQGVEFTIGTDAETAMALQHWGGKHSSCPVDDIVVDEKLKVVTTPAYMLAERISDANSGIRKLVAAVLNLCAR